VIAAWAIEGASPPLLLEIVIEEEATAVRLSGADPRFGALLATVAWGTWTPSPQGVSLDAYDTVAAALACKAGSTSLRGAIHRAIRIGGTDRPNPFAWRRRAASLGTAPHTGHPGHRNA
jgi:hypothetical protein